jgi:hypothetical protein
MYVIGQRFSDYLIDNQHSNFSGNLIEQCAIRQQFRGNLLAGNQTIN